MKNLEDFLNKWVEILSTTTSRKNKARRQADYVLKAIKEITRIKSTISISEEDIYTFLKAGGLPYLVDICVHANTAKRMYLLLKKLEVEIQCIANSINSFDQVIIFLFIPQTKPLQIEEIHSFHNWLSLNKEFEVMWGWAENNSDKFRMLVIAQFSCPNGEPFTFSGDIHLLDNPL